MDKAKIGRNLEAIVNGGLELNQWK